MSLSSSGPGLIDYASVNVVSSRRRSNSTGNNARPQFPSELAEVRVPEGAPRNTAVLELKAWNPCGGRVRYEITSGNQRGEFGLVQSTTSGGVSLRTTIVLDREIRSSYRLEVRAVAADDDGRCVSVDTDVSKQHSAGDLATVVVTVSDVNDNAPFFPANNQPIRIREGK